MTGYPETILFSATRPGSLVVGSASPGSGRITRYSYKADQGDAFATWSPLRAKGLNLFLPANPISER